MMIPDIEKIEHLLHAKAFEELNAADRELVLAHLSGKAEYEHMRETLQRVKKVFLAESAGIQAETDMKELVLSRFEQNRPTNTGLYDRISTFFHILIPTPAGRFSLALGSLLFIVTIGFLVWPSRQDEIAVNKAPLEKQPTPAIGKNEESVSNLPVQEQENRISSEPIEDLVEVSEDGAAVAEEKVQYFAAEADIQDEASGKGRDESELKKAQTEDMRSSTLQRAPEPPKYLDKEGFRQYSNSRLASVSDGSTQGSGASKGYHSPKPESTAAKEDKATAKSAEVADMKKNKDVQKALPAGGAVATGNAYETQPVIQEKTKHSIPVWPGYEAAADAYQMTREQIRAFLLGDAGRRNLDTVGRSFSIRLTFNKKGEVTEATLGGVVNEALRKEMEKKALTLPKFTFTDGDKRKSSYVQTYTF